MNIKKIVLRTVPYVCIALYGTKIGQAWRLAAGTAFAEKFLCLLYTSPSPRDCS